MEITVEQYERIQNCLPVQRGNVRHENLVLLNAILYVAEHGCKWRGLPTLTKHPPPQNLHALSTKQYRERIYTNRIRDRVAGTLSGRTVFGRSGNAHMPRFCRNRTSHLASA